jgi:c-di-AMP phosphodiesterase-like protein
MESEALLSGIMLDTKNFVLRTGVRTFEAAAFLRSSGADTVEVKRLFSNSIDTYKVKYTLVSDAEIYNFCAVACAGEGIQDIRIASAQAADELLGIENVKASFVLYKTGKTINISARSLGDLNVQVIMEALGGGGHQNMAAVQIKNESVEQVKEQLFTALNNIYSEDGEAKQYNTK